MSGEGRGEDRGDGEREVTLSITLGGGVRTETELPLARERGGGRGSETQRKEQPGPRLHVRGHGLHLPVRPESFRSEVAWGPLGGLQSLQSWENCSWSVQTRTTHPYSEVRTLTLTAFLLGPPNVRPILRVHFLK